MFLPILKFFFNIITSEWPFTGKWTLFILQVVGMFTK